MNNIDNVTFYFFVPFSVVLGCIWPKDSQKKGKVYAEKKWWNSHSHLTVKPLLIDHTLPQQMLMTNCNQVFLTTGPKGVHMYPVC